MIPDDYLNDLKSRLASQAEELCRHLLGGGKRKGRRWVCGGVDGGAGQSMNVELDGDKAGLWRDAATGEGGDLLTLWQTNQGLTFPEVVATAASFAGMLPPDTRETAPKLTHLSLASYIYEEPPAPEAAKPDIIEPPMPEAGDAPPRRGSTSTDWEKAVAGFTEDHAAKLSEWRGFSPDFVKWLHRQELIGVHNGCFAFPVHDAKGNVTRIHYRLEKGWAYHPKGGGDSSPLVIGNPIHATHTLAFESQWDALAILDKLGAHNPENEGIYAAYITRGATSNTNLSKLTVPHLIAFPQNDPPEKKSKTTGRTPAEEWLHKLQTTRHPVTEFAVFATPAPHKDANDWIREEKPDQFHIFKHAVEGARNPILSKVLSIKDLQEYPVNDDPDSLIGYEDRFLGKGGSWLWIAPSGVGKSTLLADFAFHAATGVEWHGIKFRRPMKTLVIQAENDVGDMAEMMRGAFKNTENKFLKSPDNYALLLKNYLSHQESERVGKRFTQWLEEIIRETKVELVCIDPVLSYVGDDISLQKVSAQFFREWLQPVLIRTGVIALLLHHTGKPVKDGGKGTKGWNESDFSYMGLGSSDMVNWARAVSVIIPTKQEGIFLFKHSKRGKRSGMIDKSTGMKTKEIYLRHGNPNEGLAWFQCDYDDAEDEEETPPKRGRSGEAKIKEPPTVEALMEFVPDTGGILFVDLCKKVRKAFGLSDFKAKYVVNKLRLSKLIVNDGSSWYVKRA